MIFSGGIFMVCFTYLSNSEFDQYAAFLFTILADNMEKISQTGNTREEDFLSWYRAENKALKDKNRKIILVLEENANQLIGFFQYSINEDIFRMEEIQIIPAYQGKNHIFRDLFGFVISNLNSDITFVEANALKQNDKSNAVLNRLGLKVIGTNPSGKSFQYRGNYYDLLNWFNPMKE